MWPKYQGSRQTETHYAFHRVVESYHTIFGEKTLHHQPSFLALPSALKTLLFLVGKMLAMADS